MVKRSIFCRFFAFFMALCLIIGMVPVNALAAEMEASTGETETSTGETMTPTEETEAPTEETEAPTEETEAPTEETEAPTEETEAPTEETEAPTEETEAPTEETEAPTEETEAPTEETEAPTEETEPTEEETEPTEEELTEEELALMIAIEKGVPIEGTDYVLTARKAYSVAPDITEWSFTTNTTDRQRQTVAQVLEIDLSHGYAKLAAGYGHRDPAKEGWTMKTTTDQAHLYEKTYGENVVGGINASYFDITNGKPIGHFMMKGVAYNNDKSRPWIGIFDDDSIGFFSAGVTMEQAAAQQSADRGAEVKLVDAIAGWVDLIKDGKVATTGSEPMHYPRTAIGVTEEGTIMLVESDGMQAPRSEGYNIYEFGCLLQSLGCVRAIEVDTGGSSTIISQREGESDVKLRNNPAGGGERVVSTTILVVSTAPSDGEFDHANITPNSEIYTPNSVVSLEAVGMDHSGALADGIPETAVWALAEGSENMGELSAASIDNNNAYATFTANDTCGEAVINLIVDGVVVGNVSVHIQEPDELAFASDEVNLKYEERSDLGLVAKFEGEPVNLKDGDIEWSLSDASAGKFEGNIFVVTSDKKVSCSAEITAVYGELTAKTTANIGKQPTMIIDGGDEDGWNYANIGKTVESFNGLAATDVATYHYAGRGGVVKGSVIHDSDEEYADIVRFGHNAIKLDFDWSRINGTEGACLGLGSPLDIDGTPTAIGAWVYIPEGTPVPWLRAQIATSKDGKSWTDAFISFNGAADNLTPLKNGWQYLEASLEEYAGMKIRVNSGMLFRAMVGNTPGGFGWVTNEGVALNKSQLKGYIIVDNISIVYGANNQDVIPPRVSTIQLIQEDGTKPELENGMVLNTNSANFFVTYNDNESTDEFATGVESAYFYLDGVYAGEGTKDPLGSTMMGVPLANGEHSLTFYLKDGFGNVTRETRYFTVEASEDLTSVAFETDSNPEVGQDWTVYLNTSKIADLAQLDATISITKGFKVKSVEFDSAVTGTYEFNESKGLLNVSITEKTTLFRMRRMLPDNIAKITIEVPAGTPEGVSIALQATKGSYSVKGDPENKLGFSTQSTNFVVESLYQISCDTLVVGMPAVLTVSGQDGPAAGIEVFYGNGVSLGKTGENGQLETAALTEQAATYTLYAMDAEGHRSYPLTVTSYAATGETEGKPYHIINNIPANLTTQKNISWMSNPSYSGEDAQIKTSTSAAMANPKVTRGRSSLVSYSASGVSNRVNSVTVTGLNPGTTYYYQVGDGVTWSEVRSFTTASAADASTDFFILADVQEEEALTGFTNIVNQLKQKDYDFGLQTGDIVDNVRYYNQWEDALNLFELDGIKDTDVIHVVGNHEADDGGFGGAAAKKVFNVAADWYSVEIGNIYVAVLNHTMDKGQLEQFKAWLVADAAETKCAWKVLTTHVPVYYTNPTGGGEEYRTTLPEAIEAAGIDFFFAGNDHSYARTAPMIGGEVNEDGVVYYVCGSTGGKSYAVVDDPSFNFKIATIDFNSVYMSVSASRNKITVTAYDVDTNGNASVLDEYTKEKKTCANDEHTYSYDQSTDVLTCAECGYSCKAADEFYSGFARDAKTERLMYFVSGKPQAGHILEEGKHYYFEKNFLAMEGEYTIGGEKCTFHDGMFADSSNAKVLNAGFAGEAIHFVVYSDGRLVLTGSGAMDNYGRETVVPWRNWAKSITSIQIDPRITNIGSNAFVYTSNCKSVDFGKNSAVKVIGSYSFSSASSLKEITLPGATTEIQASAFVYAINLESVFIPGFVNKIHDTAFKNCDLNKLVLNVLAGSYAENWAKSHGIKYVTRQVDLVASGTCGAKATWEVYSNGVLKIGGSGAMDNYKGMSDAPWSAYWTSISCVEIGAEITSIGDYGIYATNLKEIKFAENSKLTSIGNYAFFNKKKLTKVELPASVTKIGFNTFAYCTGLTEVYLPDGLQYMHKDAFYNCDKTKLVLSVAEGSYAANWAEKNGYKYEVRVAPVDKPIASGKCGANATWEVYSNGVLKIGGSGAMDNYKGMSDAPWCAYWTSISSVEIGAEITSIGDYGIYATNLTEIKFAENSKLTSIGNYAFFNKKKLTKVELPASVTKIGFNAFAYCTGLTEVYLPDGLQSMHEYTFYNCDKTKLVLSVAEGSYAANWAEKNGYKYEVRVAPIDKPIASGKCGANATWEVYSNGVLKIGGSGAMDNYKGMSDAPWCAYWTSISCVEIGAGITSIGDYGIYATNLKEIKFAENSKLTSIGNYAFFNKKKLTKVELPASVTKIGFNAFAYCTGLTEVHLPDGLQNMHEYAFYNCDKAKLVLGVAEGTYAENWAKKNGFKYEVRVAPVDKPIASGKCGANATWEVYSNGVLKIGGSGAMDNYKGMSDAPWCAYWTSISCVEIGAEITSIGDYGIYATNLTEIKFAENSKLTSIGNYAFFNKKKLTKVELPASVTKIGFNAFAYCTGLTEVYLPDGLQSMHEYAFYNCDKAKLVLNVAEGSYAERWAKKNGVQYTTR